MGTFGQAFLRMPPGAGGQAWLVEQARKNPVAFMALVGRVLPLQVKDGGVDPVVTTVVHHIYER